MATRIHVVGAGIAGTATALAMHRIGAKVVVHEAHPRTTTDAGAFLTLSEIGMGALQRLGVDDAVRRASAPLRSMVVTTGSGDELMSRALGEPGGPGYRYLTRARLCAALQGEARRRGIEIRHGERLVGTETDGESVTALFADGTRARGDLLVGADGLHSAVRSLLDPAAAPPRYVGHHVFYGYSDGTAADAPTDLIHFVRGASAFGSIATGREGTWWFARVSGAELDREQMAAGTSAGWAALLSSLLRDEPVPHAIVRDARRVLVTNAYDLADVHVWHRDRAVIIGDAAHAASPATGQGASMALEDAVALAETLGDTDGMDGIDGTGAALAAYEQRRRAPVEANTAASARM